ncbi:MAG: class I SAM-dependent methyltransferase [Bacilli bacterium]|nr:class I SAM-dependent methyltransferase [Bacilli bacterium]
MNFDTLKNIKDETKRINALYELFNEDNRLNRSKAARVEFLTTIKYIEAYLNEDSKILDIGAGAGEYSLYYAKRGYVVNAVELAKNNIEKFRMKITPKMKLDLREGNALDLSFYSDESFDIVLLMGPLYHLENENDRNKALSEAIRVCKKDGNIITTFITNDMIVLTELAYDIDFFKGDSYNHETFKINNFPFVFHTVEEAKKIMNVQGIEVLNIVAQDGASELMMDYINKLDEESYEQYLRYHFYICEKPEMLGMTNHLMFVCKRKDI